MLPQPQGQAMLSGSITCSTRGRLWGSARALRAFARGGLFGIGSAGRDLFLDEGDLRLRFGNRGLQIFQCQFHLRRIELFRFWPELRAAIVLNLALQLLDQFLQRGDEGVLFGHHRLLMLTGRALNRQLELHRRKGVQYLDRKVRELAEIDRLRHMSS
uniref:Uncharacterized protein n=1 Tax=Plasmid Ti TaxID=2512 RepID=Q52593_9ZZZZ|nr:unknown protein [Plasmid Ti]